jgi:hypothetical protein
LGRRTGSTREEATGEPSRRGPKVPNREATSETPATAAERGYARARARDEAIRAALPPLAPGERPTAIAVAAVAAIVIGLANLVLVVTDWSIDGRPSTAAGLGFAALMLMLGAGMWRLVYIAVIAFQALLATSIVYAFLALLLASNLAGAILAGAIVVLGGPLFWFLVRPMARLQKTRQDRGTPESPVG